RRPAIPHPLALATAGGNRREDTDPSTLQTRLQSILESRHVRLLRARRQPALALLSFRNKSPNHREAVAPLGCACCGVQVGSYTNQGWPPFVSTLGDNPLSSLAP